MAYSYHDWAVENVHSPIERSDKKKSGMMRGIKKFFTKSERPPTKKRGLQRPASDPDITDNYNKQFGQGITPSYDVTSDFNPNSFFSDDGIVDKFKIPKLSPVPKKKLPQNSSPAFEIPEYHKQNRPSLDNIFNIKLAEEKKVNSDRVSHSRKQESPLNQYESPMELLGGGSRHHSSKEGGGGRHEKRGRRYDRRPSVEASVGKF